MKIFAIKWLVFTLFLLTTFPLTAYSWNAVGHMVIADIAYQNLKPNVRAKVDELVAEFNTEYPEMKSFMNIAYWPDAIRGQKIETFTHWHYIDHPFSNDGTVLKNIIDTDNAVWAVNTIQQVVQNNHANPYDRARFLAFLTHIVADLHQPLHTVSLFSAAHVDGDRGGNLYAIRYQNDHTNVHKLWDSGVGFFNGGNTLNNAGTLTEVITTQYLASSLKEQINDLNPDDWAKEGMNNAKKYVYNTPENQEVNANYIQTGKQVAEKQAALAGYRLATILNQLLG